MHLHLTTKPLLYSRRYSPTRPSPPALLAHATNEPSGQYTTDNDVNQVADRLDEMIYKQHVLHKSDIDGLTEEMLLSLPEADGLQILEHLSTTDLKQVQSISAYVMGLCHSKKAFRSGPSGQLRPPGLTNRPYAGRAQNEYEGNPDVQHPGYGRLTDNYEKEPNTSNAYDGYDTSPTWNANTKSIYPPEPSRAPLRHDRDVAPQSWQPLPDVQQRIGYSDQRSSYDRHIPPARQRTPSPRSPTRYHERRSISPDRRNHSRDHRGDNDGRRYSETHYRSGTGGGDRRDHRADRRDSGAVENHDRDHQRLTVVKSPRKDDFKPQREVLEMPRIVKETYCDLIDRKRLPLERFDHRSLDIMRRMQPGAAAKLLQEIATTKPDRIRNLSGYFISLSRRFDRTLR